jgi:hypothetical protein
VNSSPFFYKVYLTHTPKTPTKENMTKIHFDDKRDKKIIMFMLDNALNVLYKFFKDDDNLWAIIKDIEFIIAKLDNKTT